MAEQLQQLVPFIVEYLDRLTGYLEKDVAQYKAALLDKTLSVGPYEECNIENERAQLWDSTHELESVRTFRNNLNGLYGSEAHAAAPVNASPAKDPIF